MKTVLVVFIITCYCTVVNAQQNSVSAGGDLAGSEGSIAFSLGQVDYLNYTDGGAMLNAGMQQPLEVYEVLAVLYSEPDISLAIYPNPFRHSINVDASDLDSVIEIEVFSLDGSLLLTRTITDPIEEINLDYLPAGTYVLNVMVQSGSNYKFYKIVKQ